MKISLNKFLVLINLLIGICISIGLLLIPQYNLEQLPNSTVISKFLLFSVICIVLSVLVTIGFLFSKKRNISFSKLDIWILLFFLFITLNRYVIHADFGFSIRYLELFGLTVFYIVLRYSSSNSIFYFLLAIVFSGILQAFHGILQLLGILESNHSGFVMTGSFFNPGPFAGFLASVWPISLGMYLFKEKIIEQVQNRTQYDSGWKNIILSYVFKYLPFIGIVSICLILPATRSRAAWLAVICSSFLLLENKYKLFRGLLGKLNKAKKLGLGLIVFLLLGLFSVFIFQMKEGSSNGRLFIWKVSAGIIKDNPIFGVGFDQFKTNYMNYQANYFLENGDNTEVMVADNTNYAFNEWLQFFVENGLVGFLLLIGVVGCLAKIKSKKEENFLLILLSFSLVGVGVFAFFSYAMEILPIKLILVFLLASLAKIDSQSFTLKLMKKNNFMLCFKTIVFGLFVFFLLNTTVGLNNLVSKYRNWYEAKDLYKFREYDLAVDEYEALYPYFEKNGNFLMEYGKTLSLNNKYLKAVSVLKKAEKYLNNSVIQIALGDNYKGLKQYKESEEAYRCSSNMLPNRFYPKYLLVKLFEESGQNKKAVLMAEELLNKKIKVNSTAIAEIKEEMRVLLKKQNQ